MSALLAVTTSAFVPPISNLWRLDQREVAKFVSKEGEKADDEAPPVAATKPKSRLAQLAEDWLEEEEDELQMYWDRFEENKVNGNTAARSEPQKEVADDENLTTEQRLERYFDSRGIHKGNERKYASQIEQAISKAQSAQTPEQAIAVLSEVQPYLQVRTRLGGMALYELAVALWQRDGEPDEDLMQELIQKNPHVKQKVQQLARRKEPPKRNPSTSTFWQGLLDSSQWWN